MTDSKETRNGIAHTYCNNNTPISADCGRAGKQTNISSVFRRSALFCNNRHKFFDVRLFPSPLTRVSVSFSWFFSFRETSSIQCYECWNIVFVLSKASWVPCCSSRLNCRCCCCSMPLSSAGSKDRVSCCVMLCSLVPALIFCLSRVCFVVSSGVQMLKRGLCLFVCLDVCQIKWCNG